jgi:hypothetical protein
LFERLEGSDRFLRIEQRVRGAKQSSSQRLSPRSSEPRLERESHVLVRDSSIIIDRSSISVRR